MTSILRACLALAYLLLAVGFAYAGTDWGLETSARLVAMAVAAACFYVSWRAWP